MASSKYPRKRKKGPTSVDWWNAPSAILRFQRERYQATLDVIASGDLRAVVERGRYLAAEVLDGTAAYPNLNARMIEDLRDAYAFFVTGVVPAERG